MALRDQRHPIGTGAEGVELLESEADDLETTVPAALADEMALVRVELGGHSSDLTFVILRSCWFSSIRPSVIRGHWEVAPGEGAGFQGRTDGLCSGKGKF